MQNPSTIVYQYGCLPPTREASEVEKQIELANDYWNALAEIENERRDVLRKVLGKKDALIGEVIVEIATLKAELDGIRAQIKLKRAKTKARTGEDQLRAKAKELADQLKIKRAEAKEKRSELKLPEKIKEFIKAYNESGGKTKLVFSDDVDQEVQEQYGDDATFISEAEWKQYEGLIDIYKQIGRSNIEANRKGKTARAAAVEAGLYWGTYTLIEEQMQASQRRTKLWRWSNEEKDYVPHGPRKRSSSRSRESGSIGVQVQKSRQLPTIDVMNGLSSWINITLNPLWPNPSKTQRKRRRGTLMMRIGSTRSKNPIWTEFPILMHRPIPDDAVIVRAKVKCERIAGRKKWTAFITANVPEGSRCFGSHNKPEKRGDGLVSINFGWRKLEDGNLRVGYFVDDDGGQGQLMIDPVVVSGLRKVEELQALRARLLNETKTLLSAWIADHDTPEWFNEFTEHLSQWKKTGHFVALLERWKENRFEDDEDGYKILEDWRYGTWLEELGRRDGGDLHLMRWQTYQRRKSLNRRKDYYRQVATTFARRYSALAFEEFDLSRTQRHHRAEDEQPEIKAVRLAQRDVAISELRECFVQAFASRDGKAYKVKARGNTQRCHICGCEEPWDAMIQISHVCPQCGERWDQDYNNAKNIERRFREDVDDRKDAITKSLPKWERLGRHKKGARKDGDKSPEKQDD